MDEAFFGRVELFKRLNPGQRRRLAAASREKRYAKGEAVFRAGEAAETVCIVKEGRVHLMRFLESGQASTTCVMTGGETFCCLPALDRKPYPVDAIAAVDSCHPDSDQRLPGAPAGQPPPSSRTRSVSSATGCAASSSAAAWRMTRPNAGWRRRSSA